MNTFYSLKDQQAVIKLLQITDSHLFSAPEESLLGVNTYQSLKAVVSQIQAEQSNFDAILATGDLIQDYQVQGYEHFANIVKPLRKPVFWLEGNHDEQPQMSLQLGKYTHIRPEKHIFAGEKWQILLLNSQVAAAPSGFLSNGQLAWLKQKLTENSKRFSLIVLHHNILPTNSAWLDQHSLKNSDKLAEVLMPFPNVKAILHGHIHQAVDSKWEGKRILATPSTSIQFKPSCHNFTLDNLAPGWRELQLYADGRIETQLKRLKNNTFLPCFNATGY